MMSKHSIKYKCGLMKIALPFNYFKFIHLNNIHQAVQVRNFCWTRSLLHEPKD